MQVKLEKLENMQSNQIWVRMENSESRRHTFQMEMKMEISWKRSEQSMWWSECPGNWLKSRKFLLLITWIRCTLPKEHEEGVDESHSNFYSCFFSLYLSFLFVYPWIHILSFFTFFFSMLLGIWILIVSLIFLFVHESRDSLSLFYLHPEVAMISIII